MKTESIKPTTIDDYIAGFPPDAQERLQKIRSIMQKEMPKAEEAIKYQIPTFVLQGNVLSFAAYKTHIGIYPVPKGTLAFQKDISSYKSVKSTAKFPLDKPMPLTLIHKLIKFRLKEHLEKVSTKNRGEVMAKTDFKTMDDYIQTFPEDVQVILEQVRQTIQKAAPKAEETIKYQLPTFTLEGNLVYFAAFKNHIGFYPMPSGIATFKKELSQYKGAKGSVQFPMDQPMPLRLISKIVKYRTKENLTKAKTKEK